MANYDTYNSDMTTDTEPTNNADRWALVALTISVLMVLSCVPGVNCITPLAPLIVGIIALSQANKAANPERAQTYGWIATGIGIVIIIGVLLITLFYGVVIFEAIREIEQQSR